MEDQYWGRNRAGVDVDPAKLRQARLDAGVSLNFVAAGRISRAAVHQYETGQARPSPEVLQHLAARLGKAPESFMLDPAKPFGERRVVTKTIHTDLAETPLDELLELASRRINRRISEWKPELSAAEYEFLSFGAAFLRSFAAAARSLGREFD